MTSKRKVAFVTGASRGIGAETAVALARAGYDVAITARTLEEGERHEHGAWQSNTEPLPGSLMATARLIEAAGGRALPMRADILEVDTVLAAVQQTRDTLGPIDLLFNNACYQGQGNMAYVLDIEPGHLRNIYQGNVFTPLQTIQAVLPDMLERGTGTVINMVSGSALMDPPAPADKGGWGFAYSSSKAALIRMAGVLRVEHADSGLRFFNVEPGFVVTEVMKANGITEETAKRFKPTSPEHIARVITWLAGSEAALGWQTKTVIHAPALGDAELGSA
ncbi:MAG TPA: SDR family oxidoreductase [Spongiibacteraceae bacterium]|jgi:NAD(P)-dependent dehydrogenase (short-subunit alcohol dehydrogenase family)|nr:SDR family oxidoreductase [Spongiibacteraceae bacterium]HUH37742.1 SDR family oxidoreductase [Spongiibacteraceae bacterium]